MVITFVMDQFGETSNGTTMTAMRFADILRKKGHELRVLTASKIEGDGIYVLPEFRIPVFQSIVDKQGMKFAEPDAEIMKKAIEGSDVVHMLMPFWASGAAVDIANELHIATTAAFHIQPENMTYSVHMGKIPVANKLIYTFLRNKFYKKFNYIHCPSQMMKDLLVKNKYRGNIFAISNGVCEDFMKKDIPRPEKYRDKYVILMVGRYSHEKRQDLIIKAIGSSKYNDKIQLVLAGKGPTKSELERLGKKYLKNPVEFPFLQKDELIDLINTCDLYVHSSDAESEAISCIEAFTCGLVPVISDSKLCATKQFALSEHNLFKKGDYNSLREKIEWFIEHPDEKEKLSRAYLEYSKQFAIDACVDRLIEVFQTAIDENRIKWENAEKEKEYISHLSAREVKAYDKGKKKYLKNLDKQNKNDFTESYINTVLH